jgi:hypothetical protein
LQLRLEEADERAGKSKLEKIMTTYNAIETIELIEELESKNAPSGLAALD